MDIERLEELSNEVKDKKEQLIQEAKQTEDKLMQLKELIERMSILSEGFDKAGFNPKPNESKY